MSDEDQRELLRRVQALLRVLASSFISVHRCILRQRKETEDHLDEINKALRELREEQRWDKFRRGWFAAMWAVTGAVLAMAVQATTLLREWWTG